MGDESSIYCPQWHDDESKFMVIISQGEGLPPIQPKQYLNWCTLLANWTQNKMCLMMMLELWKQSYIMKYISSYNESRAQVFRSQWCTVRDTSYSNMTRIVNTTILHCLHVTVNGSLEVMTFYMEIKSQYRRKFIIPQLIYNEIKA